MAQHRAQDTQLKNQPEQLGTTRVSSDAAPSTDVALALEVPAGGSQWRLANAGPSPVVPILGTGCQAEAGRGARFFFFALPCRFWRGGTRVGIYLCAKAFMTSGFASSGSHFFPMARERRRGGGAGGALDTKWQ